MFYSWAASTQRRKNGHICLGHIYLPIMAILLGCSAIPHFCGPATLPQSMRKLRYRQVIKVVQGHRAGGRGGFEPWQSVLISTAFHSHHLKWTECRVNVRLGQDRGKEECCIDRRCLGNIIAPSNPHHHPRLARRVTRTHPSPRVHAKGSQLPC